MTDNNLTQKYEKLKDLLRSYEKVVVAYSGGVDSVFLLRAAVEVLGRENVLACIGISESLAEKERDQATELAKEMGAELEQLNTDELAIPAYQENPVNRCFFCKSELFKRLTELARRRGYRHVLSGANKDDLGDFRPGEKAAKKYGVKSPLQEAGLTKNDIRALSRQLDLPTWDKPAQPCLASRMMYGLKIYPERLKQIEQGENYLRDLTGIRELRVRHHDRLARIEVPVQHLHELVNSGKREEIVTYFKQLGFTYVSLDMQGFRSGSANEIMS